MTDGTPGPVGGTAPRRPDTARPRTEAAHDDLAPPSQAELEAIELQQAEWARLLGAEVVVDAELGATLVRYPDPGPGFNLAARIRWPEAEVATRLAEVERRMREADRWPSIIVTERLTQPRDLDDRLSDAGWSSLGGERIMFTRHAPVVPHLDPGLRVEAVTPASALECVTLETAVFGLQIISLGERAEQLAHAVSTGAIRAFLLRLVHEPVATTRLAPGRGVSGLHGIGVAAKHRHRGYGRMITAVATRAGLVTGRGLVWLSVDEENVPAMALYRSLGYQPSFRWRRWAAPNRSSA